MKRRMIYLLSALLLVGCGSGRNAPAPSSPSSAPKEEDMVPSTVEPFIKPEVITIDPDEFLPTGTDAKENLFEIEPGQVIVDENDIRVTTIQAVNGGFGQGFRYKIENNTDKTLICYQDITTINGYDAYYTKNAWGWTPPGVNYGSYYFDVDHYEECGIDIRSIGEIGGQFYFVDKDTNALVCESKPFMIKTNKFDQISKLDESKFETAYEDDSVKVMILPEKKFFSDGMLCMIKNKMNKGHIYHVAVNVNGQYMNCLLDVSATPGGTALGRMKMFPDQLAEAGIKDYDDIKNMTMTVYGSQLWNYIDPGDYESPEFTIPYYRYPQ